MQLLLFFLQLLLKLKFKTCQILWKLQSLLKDVILLVLLELSLLSLIEFKFKMLLADGEINECV